MNDVSRDTSSSQLHQSTTNQKEVEISSCNGAHVKNELESGSSNKGRDFDPSIDLGCFADESGFNQYIDSSCSADSRLPNVPAKLFPKQI